MLQIVFIVAVAKDQFVFADDGKLEFLMLHALKLSKENSNPMG